MMYSHTADETRKDMGNSRTLARYSPYLYGPGGSTSAGYVTYEYTLARLVLNDSGHTFTTMHMLQPSVP